MSLIEIHLLSFLRNLLHILKLLVRYEHLIQNYHIFIFINFQLFSLKISNILVRWVEIIL